jgi:hypothetical protein
VGVRGRARGWWVCGAPMMSGVSVLRGKGDGRSKDEARTGFGLSRRVVRVRREGCELRGSRCLERRGKPWRGGSSLGQVNQRKRELLSEAASR